MSLIIVKVFCGLTFPSYLGIICGTKWLETLAFLNSEEKVRLSSSLSSSKDLYGLSGFSGWDSVWFLMASVVLLLHLFLDGRTCYSLWFHTLSYGLDASGYCWGLFLGLNRPFQSIDTGWPLRFMFLLILWRKVIFPLGQLIYGSIGCIIHGYIHLYLYFSRTCLSLLSMEMLSLASRMSPLTVHFFLCGWIASC